jgi:hypothetical protein
MYRRGSLNVVIAVLMGVVLVMGGVLVVISNRDTSMNTSSDASTAVRSDAEMQRAEIEPLAENATALVLEYTGDVALTPADRDQLTNRVAAPMREYYAEMGEDKSVIKLLVSAESASTYNVAVFHSDQSTEEFILTKFEEGFDWWRPQCDGECTFSERFAQKYPHIVQNTSN